MLLTVDVGNTNIVFGFFQNDKLMETFRLVTKEKRTTDEWGLPLLQFISRMQASVDEIEAVVIASVVPSVMPSLLRAIETYLGQTPLVIDRDIIPTLQYEGEGRLGADRAVCCDAAIHKYGAPLLVIDLGTATTFDAVSDTGWYLGGCSFSGSSGKCRCVGRKGGFAPAN